ncbi:MAG: hypothetical protein IPP48_04960 [Chitinophagaceae bacterium]|nr:hypothetical protein [Chitinophagaceae bacterium]
MQKQKKIRTIFIIYWIFLAYIIAALIWWFIALNEQNKQMTAFQIQDLKPGSPSFAQEKTAILALQKRKTVQYIGEGITFFFIDISRCNIYF